MRGNFTSNCQEYKVMSAVDYASQARSIYRTIERRQSVKSGTIENARAALARVIGCTKATLERLAGDRLKTTPARLMDRLKGAYIDQLTNEIRELTHELEMARQIGADPRVGEIAQIEADLAKLKQLMGIK